PGVWLDGEDALEVGRWRHEGDAVDPTALRVAVVRFPRISNATDVDALAGETGVDVQVTTNPATCAAADIVVLPGSRSTIDDLAWLRSTGIAEVVAERAAQGRTVVGICGGYQMLARTIDDPQGQEVAGGAQVPGLGLLPVDVDFAAEKTLTLSHGTWQGIEVGGYEIHHGTTTADTDAEPFLDGVHVGSVWGTMWHGAFEHDEFRRTWLAQAAQVAGSSWRPHTDELGYQARREAMIDTLADALVEHVDVDTLLTLGR
ncbi:MAG: cobyric acid synthase CobQ, partial [Cutibacterium granulosum]|nr:cobyric acid synthase CobQ [Cutibacterium granulosum]